MHLDMRKMLTIEGAHPPAPHCSVPPYPVPPHPTSHPPVMAQHGPTHSLQLMPDSANDAIIPEGMGGNSWMPKLAKSDGGSWLLAVEDHQMNLEDTNEALSSKDMVPRSRIGWVGLCRVVSC